MIRIGTDVSIQECRAMAYPVVLLKSKKDIDKLDPTKDIHLTISNPEHWPDGINKVCGYVNEIEPYQLYRFNQWISFNELKEVFLSNGEEIKSFCDFENCPIELETPCIYDFLHLASSLDGYYGLANLV